MQNSSIIQKSSKKPGNQLRFLIQDQQPAIKLISPLQIEKKQWSSTSQNWLEPKSHLALALTFKILALDRNVVKSREIMCTSPSKTINWLSG
jgi:hypothetical protein